MWVHGKAIEPTSSGCGRMASASPIPPVISPWSECITHFGAAVVPDVEYSQRTASPSVGGAGSVAGSPSGSVSVTTRISNGSPVLSCRPFAIAS